jgi:Fur family iron response transcriptional regulator
MRVYSEGEIGALLRERDIQATAQRVLITRVLFNRWTHMSADDVYQIVNAEDRQVSKATVYNTLGLLTEKGVIREVIADPSKIFYDPNTAPHHHFFHVDSGELTDIEGDAVEVNGLPPLPQGARLEGVDVIVRLRSAPAE